jgi:hypothetical protein
MADPRCAETRHDAPIGPEILARPVLGRDRLAVEQRPPIARRGRLDGGDIARHQIGLSPARLTGS